MWFNAASYDNWRFCISARRILVSLQVANQAFYSASRGDHEKLKQLFLKIELKAGK